MSDVAVYRKEIPERHRLNLDTRLQWLWDQRFGTVQTIWLNSTDVLDHTAATLILQCVLGNDLVSIELLFQRLEGGSVFDASKVEGTVAL